MGILTAAAVKKTAFLVVMACNTEGACPESVDAEAWYGTAPKAECQTFVKSGDFDPSDYLKLKGEEEYYAVSCDEVGEKDPVFEITTFNM